MAAADIQEFLQQNRAEAAEVEGSRGSGRYGEEEEEVQGSREEVQGSREEVQGSREEEEVQGSRGYWESDQHWAARRDFILRNKSDFRPDSEDQLLSLSMVWANHVFMGCRYSEQLLQRVGEMADGIDVKDAPVFKTRDEIMKKQQGR